MRRFIVSLISLLWPLGSFATETIIPCQNEIQKILKAWQVSSPRSLASQESLLKQLAGSDISFSENEKYFFFQRQKSKIFAEFTLNTKTCESSLQTRPVWDRSLAPQKHSAKIETILKESCKKPILVYSWSPKMNISVLGLTEAMHFAKSKNISIYAFTEADHLSLAQQIINSGRVKSLGSVDDEILKYQGVQNHYPSFAFASKCQLSDLQFGYRSRKMLQTEWESLVK
jgi:hypothetical protein